MKKLILLAAITLTGFGAFAQNTWNWGLTFGAMENPSKFSGGMSSAAAIFRHSAFGGNYFGVVFRKSCNPHVTFETGIKIVSLGFKYELAQDYSLTSHHPDNTVNIINLGMVNFPFTSIYTSNFNCANWRWYAGLGLNFSLGGQKTDLVKTINPSDEITGNTTTNSYLSQTVHFAPVLTPDVHAILGVEKKTKGGHLWTFGWIWNWSFKPIATSTITYTANNQQYTHTFTNYGCYSGFTISYHFRDFGAEKVVKMQ